MVRTSSFTLFLLGTCLSQPAFADEPKPIPRATTQQVQRTVERAIGYLQTESAAWLSTRKCAACHHAPMPLWALSEADRQGYAIDKKFLADTAEATLGSLEKMIASKLVSNPADPPDPRPSAKGVNMGTVFMAVSAQSLPILDKGKKQSLRLIADEIVKKQLADGSWEFFANLRRPPINESQITDAVWIILALQGEIERDPSESQRGALKKATAWLAGAKVSDNLQEKVLKALMAIRAGQSRNEMQIVIDELLARQRTDGGWSQTTEMTSDAFATGQTLYVLSLAGYTAEQPDIKRAINFLVATEKPDGSWPMTSRSTPDGKPGSAKLLTPITCAASAWATLGLARLAPKRP
jgi:Squalene-hopene cyclase C-terminal domain